MKMRSFITIISDESSTSVNTQQMQLARIYKSVQKNLCKKVLNIGIQYFLLFCIFVVFFQICNKTLGYTANISILPLATFLKNGD